jgi:uncharacterized DUF497 family protein
VTSAAAVTVTAPGPAAIFPVAAADPDTAAGRGRGTWREGARPGAGLDDAQFSCYKKSVKLEWDPEKAKQNEQKHGVSFEEAATCFDDPDGCYFRNESPSYEDRLILIAMSSRPHVLFVVHAEVGRESIRIVSARKASPAQKRIYDGLD